MAESSCRGCAVYRIGAFGGRWLCTGDYSLRSLCVALVNLLSRSSDPVLAAYHSNTAVADILIVESVGLDFGVS